MTLVLRDRANAFSIKKAADFWRTIKTPAEIESSQVHQPSAFETVTCKSIARTRAHGHFEGPTRRSVVFEEERMRRKLAASGDGDRRRVKILAAVVIDGLPGVEAACLQALSEGRLRPTSSSTSSRVSEIRGQRRQFRHPTPYGSARHARHRMPPASVRIR